MRQLQYRDLEPVERRVALMHVAGASLSSIAEFLSSSAPTVAAMLKRPRVSNYVAYLFSHTAEEVGQVIQPLNEAIKEKAARAFEIEETVMERLFAETDNVRAQLGAVATAQDILDRAGERAPTKNLNVNAHVISPQTIEQLGAVLKEVKQLAQG